MNAGMAMAGSPFALELEYASLKAPGRLAHGLSSHIPND
jgi:hypothetical protein